MMGFIKVDQIVDYVCDLVLTAQFSCRKSREKWPYSLLRPSRVDHGEKSNIFCINQNFGKLDALLDFEDCINHNNREEAHSVLKENQTRIGIQGSSGQKLQLKMEIYRDLSEFYPLKAGKTHPSVTDELNTPVFGTSSSLNHFTNFHCMNVTEKAHFDYDRQLHSSDLLNVITSNEDQQNSKVKIEVPNMDTVNIDDMNNILIQEDGIASENKDLNLISVDKDATKILNYVVISSQGINSNHSNMHTLDNSEYEYIYHDSNKVTPMLQDLVCEEEEYLPTVNNYSDIFFSNNDSACIENLDMDNTSVDFANDQYIVLDATSVASPDTSKSSSESSFQSNPFNLQLDCSKFKIADSLNTPDVIETIDAIELEKGFNILDFITEDDIKQESTVPTEDVSLSSSLSTDPPRQIRKRKLKSVDDDDEDYEPPLSFTKHFSSSFKKQKHSYLDIENEDKSKPARRGRPPKRPSTVTSRKVCAEEDEKYREMRDKNNEASRKSRLKRKLKENAQEEEVQELEERNIKLKAQVSELERTDIKQESTVPTEDVSLSSSLSSSLSTDPPRQIRKRKLKSVDDDDEDYEPPLSFTKHFSSSSKKQKHSYLDIENEDKSKPARRGRPPKRPSTVTSRKVCAEEDEKYREMRDKNNEASRKSRLKRKLKENAQEEEVQELEERNIKLKAQVSELERTDIKQESTVPTEDVSLSSSLSTDPPRQIRKRKLKSVDDDDEDYEPPLSFTKHFSSSSKKQKHSYLDIENEDKSKPARRGRPPKRPSTVTSRKVCAEEDEKYREMRDKNNEASRKSRLKRKLKENAQEEEVQELEERNIKLKAQVSELERTVNNFRTNLMQLLMKK
ncbi:hypothetical protein FQR65_LT11163 [Abscondita terminalis]|nr:hypothetical protein FQR65_LT11163 [Abscondita terminalis]